tara:strand:+ start:219 stop:434 length:216 start_codon:yes stop_codon:yes gene_type:complete
MCTDQLNDRAHSKAFAKITMLTFEIDHLKYELKSGITPGISLEETAEVLEGTKTEYAVWSHILELIEKQNN